MQRVERTSDIAVVVWFTNVKSAVGAVVIVRNQWRMKSRAIKSVNLPSSERRRRGRVTEYLRFIWTVEVWRVVEFGAWGGRGCGVERRVN